MLRQHLPYVNPFIHRHFKCFEVGVRCCCKNLRFLPQKVRFLPQKVRFLPQKLHFFIPKPSHFQNLSFCPPNSPLLPSKTYPFGTQNQCLSISTLPKLYSLVSIGHKNLRHHDCALEISLKGTGVIST